MLRESIRCVRLCNILEMQPVSATNLVIDFTLKLQPHHLLLPSSLRTTSCLLVDLCDLNHGLPRLSVDREDIELAKSLCM